MMKHTHYLALLLALTLSGCSTLQDEQGHAPINKRMTSTERGTKLDALHSWHANGSIGITHRGKSD
ncbi:MAG: hypothetical protein M3R00_08045, partial [Pseudomonadota bacterium]|nr:hypothetical protein [Pseudomonadota bacterium]